MRLLLLVVLVLLPQLVSARVYMCVDPATGKKTFTDRACDVAASREEVRVDSTNLDSGSRYAQETREKHWVSQRENRRSGLDYRADRRHYSERRTARVD